MDGIDPTVPPNGTGCQECLADGGWWFHLRRCAQCGHIGCCDSSPSQHTTAHYKETDHPFIQSFEPGEDWFYNYPENAMYNGPQLAAPDSRPADQPAPGPAGKVPPNWMDLLHG